MKSPHYRPEIDGFRALAVATVVLFHAGVPGFANGFVGVDIFFVISGFLITSIITHEQMEERFSYSRFVIRRVRRILPAQVSVMLACIPFAWWLMLPDPLENFGQSLVATALSANNILLWLTSGYWDLASEYKPLLHTWSLGVEEQFYILYPMLLMLALKLRMSACYALMTAMAALSFVLMATTLQNHPAATFYLLHTRAWQLLVGGIAGLMAVHSGPSERSGLAGLGLAMVLISMMPWQGMSMIATLVLATLGTALYLLYANATSRLTWVFTRRPVIFVGLVSYSFYLWHQPVLAFLRVGFFEYPAPELVALGVALAFGLAVLSWRYIETPFRSAQRTKTGLIWGFVGGGTVLAIGIGLAMHLTAGFPHRLNYPGDEGYAGASVAYNERVRTLLPREIPGGGDQPVVLVAGNSFARDFSNVLLEAEIGENVTLLYRDDLTACAMQWSDTERALIARLDMLIFASGSYSESCVQQSLHASKEAGLQVFFVGPKQFGANLNPLMRLTAEERAATLLQISNKSRIINESQRAFVGQSYIDLLSLFSDDTGEKVLVANQAGVLLTTDRVHLSQAGARFVATHLTDLLPNIKVLTNPHEEER